MSVSLSTCNAKDNILKEMPVGNEYLYLNSGFCCSLKALFSPEGWAWWLVKCSGVQSYKIKYRWSLTKPTQQGCQWMQWSTLLLYWSMDYAQPCRVQKNDTFNTAGWELIKKKTSTIFLLILSSHFHWNKKYCISCIATWLMLHLD